MATNPKIHVLDKAKFIFDVSFTVYPDAVYEEVVVSDVLDPGFSSAGLERGDVTITIQPVGGVPSTIEAADAVCILPLADSGLSEEIKVTIRDEAVVTPQEETKVIVSLPVVVSDKTALLDAKTIKNTAVVTAGEEDCQVQADFDIIPENISLFMKKATIENNTTDVAYVTVSFPAIQSQPTADTIYYLTLEFNDEFTTPRLTPENKPEIHGILQHEDYPDSELDRGTDFTAGYLPKTGTAPATFNIEIKHKEEYKGHTFYFYVPVTLESPLSPFPENPFLGSPVRIRILDLEDDNIHLTEVLPTHTKILGGEKTVR